MNNDQGTQEAGAVKEVDYIIVGAGSAGCVMASRLSEDRDSQVLLLEAGGSDWDPLIHIPLGWGMIYTRKLHDWHLRTEPEAQLNDRRVEFARGKVVGGSSSVNAMAYVRGHSSDYDRWAAAGLQGWSYEDTLPYFRRQENWEGGQDHYRGGDGPLTTRMSTYQDPLVDASIAAAVEAGFGFNPDYNGAEQEGVARLQATIRNGRRCSAAVAYLNPALARPNLQLLIKARSTRVLMNGSSAVGVEYVHRGARRIARARREVILCAGAALSPHLLMLSGIGPADELSRIGIDPLIDLPRVGKNLRDHISAGVMFRRKSAGPFHAAMRYDRIAIKMIQAAAFGSGLASDVPCGVIGFLRTPLAVGAAPDLQIWLNAAPLAAKPYLHQALGSFQDGFGLRFVLLRPQSQGSVSLQSSDPLRQPRIHQNFLQHEHEWRVLREGVRMVRDIANQPALADFLGDETTPGIGASAVADLDAFIRERAVTTHHPLGSCAMAKSGELGVVDNELRVFGAQKLRVVDASVMPDMVGGNINAAVIMIAEKAADAIRGRSALERSSKLDSTADAQRASR